jgi:hypothetical protein
VVEEVNKVKGLQHSLEEEKNKCSVLQSQMEKFSQSQVQTKGIGYLVDDIISKKRLRDDGTPIYILKFND